MKFIIDDLKRLCSRSRVRRRASRKLTYRRLALLFYSLTGEGIENIEGVPGDPLGQHKLVSTKTKRYVIKVVDPKNPAKIDRQVLAFRKLWNRVPMPRVYYHNNEILVEEFVGGADLSVAKLDRTECNRVYESLGRHLREIHNVRAEGFGRVDMHGRGEFRSLREKVDSDTRGALSFMRSQQLLSEGELARLGLFLKAHQCYLGSSQCVFLHGDYVPQNIKVANGDVLAILDFADLAAGPPALDLARPFIESYRQERLDVLLRSYGWDDVDELRCFAVITLMWMIPRNATRGECDKVRKKLEILRDILPRAVP